MGDGVLRQPAPDLQDGHPHRLGKFAQADESPLVGRQRLLLMAREIRKGQFIAGGNCLADKLPFAYVPLPGQPTDTESVSGSTLT